MQEFFFSFLCAACNFFLPTSACRKFFFKITHPPPSRVKWSAPKRDIRKQRFRVPCWVVPYKFPFFFEEIIFHYQFYLDLFYFFIFLISLCVFIDIFVVGVISIVGGKVSGFERKSFTQQNSPDSRAGFRIQSRFHFKFWIQNLRKHDRTGKFLFGIVFDIQYQATTT